MTKRRLDRYHYIGIAVLMFLIALWVAHIVLPNTGPAAPV